MKNLRIKLVGCINGGRRKNEKNSLFDKTRKGQSKKEAIMALPMI